MTTHFDEYFGEVRALLNQPPGEDAWAELCDWLTIAWEEDADRVRAQWLPYVSGALGAWPDTIKQSPEDWRTFSRQELYALAVKDASPYGDLPGAHEALTANGALSHATSGSALLDYFAKAGTYRDRPYEEVARDLARCWETSSTLTVRMIFYLRAVTRQTRGFYRADAVLTGQGARDEARKGWLWLSQKHPSHFYENMWLVPVIGVWKDLWHADLIHALDREKVYDLIERGMNDRYNSELLAKYLPKIRSKSNTKHQRHRDLNAFARGLRKRLGWSEKEYRQFKRSGASHDFQRKMCARDWYNIDFNRIPGRALSQLVFNTGKDDNLTTLQRRGLEWMYQEWLGTRGTVNFTGYVHELVPLAASGSSDLQKETADKQFETCLERARGKDGIGMQGDVLCALDTSGSMQARVHNTTAYDICVGLGVFFSALNEGAYKDHVVMFDNESRDLELYGSFTERVRQLRLADTAWGGTNFQSVIDELVRRRRANMHRPASDFPQTIVVVSDMQFNPAGGGNKRTNYEVAKRKLEEVGLSGVRIVWWWVTGRENDMPARLDDEGVILIGGFDGAILKLLLDGEQIVVDSKSGEERKLNPLEQMVRALDQETLRLIRA